MYFQIYPYAVFLTPRQHLDIVHFEFPPILSPASSTESYSHNKFPFKSYWATFFLFPCLQLFSRSSCLCLFFSILAFIYSVSFVMFIEVPLNLSNHIYPCAESPFPFIHLLIEPEFFKFKYSLASEIELNT